MKRQYLLFLLAGALLVTAWISYQPVDQLQPVATDTAEYAVAGPVTGFGLPSTEFPAKAVLSVSVHTIEELEVLLERAEQYAMTPRSRKEEANIVLVLHGPEVEFFSTRNYDKYKTVVDRAARLDAFDIVDVKICQTMMSMNGIERDDIPSFIEQVSLGPAEIDRLEAEGYLRF